jgi:hypothetical protein
MPKAGRPGKPGGRLRGLSRTSLIELDGRGEIKVVAIRKPGAVKAIRLVYLPSLDAYLHRLATEGLADSTPSLPAKVSPAPPKKQPRKFP